ncbi:DUF4386 domain-containing protein [Chengkuizengella axinellae]|uniref:DUF4386 domain-containing protein n=1 Tax=Chengkuizengella axinellae TaxID=3064388 RepID=A0ABT9J537_9BACL|nr:DUF4386 domain-containing protein [Chengkuizengella sp. 2205SS18-9]MDP5276732.1 DUF4386 domain-containing protein [Chengkuizengella sp. 2205SS18-9]
MITKNNINKNHAMLMVLCVLIAVSVLSVNMLNHIAPLLLLNNSDYLSVFETSQLHSFSMFFLELHSYGYLIAQIFFGLWLFPLGYLVYKSGFIPKMIGILLMLGCFGYLIDFFISSLYPNSLSLISLIVTVPADLGEFSLCLWLLIVGVKIKEHGKKS